MLNRLKQVFASFEGHDVRYVVIGGIAAGRDVDKQDVRLLSLDDDQAKP